MIFINFKAYKSGVGKGALVMAQKIEEVSKRTDVKIIIALQPTDISSVSKNVSVEVWSQIIDPVEPGAHTGSITAEAILDSGATGVFINHSESRLNNFEDIKFVNQKAKSLGLKTLIFAKDLIELGEVLKLGPDFVSYEPPALIGSKDKSVASAEPDVISKASEMSKEFNIPLIVGAGVHSKEDVKTSLSLGALGIVVASDIMNAEDPQKELWDLIEGFN